MADSKLRISGSSTATYVASKTWRPSHASWLAGGAVFSSARGSERGSEASSEDAWRQHGDVPILPSHEGRGSPSRSGRTSLLLNSKRISLSTTRRSASFECGDMDTVSAPGKAAKGAVWRCVPSCGAFSRAIMQSPSFSTCMFMLSVYTLFGDDVRLAFFAKDSDQSFDFVTLTCMFFFALENVISSVAIQDYFLSFFWVLDIIATVSLIFDVSFVWEALVGSKTLHEIGSEEQGGSMAQSEYARASRAGRLGTRVVRILRVLRLIRIVRMFKFFLTIRRNCSNRSYGVPPDGDDTDQEDQQNESRVGKKLLERTTIWVVLLVLVLLVMVPFLSSKEDDTMMHTSAQYGLDVVHQAWRDYVSVGGGATGTADDRTAMGKRITWEQQVLTYIYYHNWHGGNCSGDFCTASNLHRLCFLGYITDSVSSNLTANASHGMRGYIRELGHAVSLWEQDLFVGGSSWSDMVYVLGELPMNIKQKLAQPWPVACDESTDGLTVYGVSLIPGVDCPWVTFRLMETQWYQPWTHGRDDRSTGGRFVVCFDTRSQSHLEGLMSVGRTMFIVFVLMFGSMTLGKDTDRLVLHPIEKMITTLEAIRSDPLYAIRLGDEEWRLQLEAQEKQDTFVTRINATVSRGSRSGSTSLKVRKLPASSTEKPVETKILENTIIKLGSLLALGFGEAGSEIIGQNLDDDDGLVDVMVPGRKLQGVFGFCRIRCFFEVTEILQGKTMIFANQVAEIVHQIVDEHIGAANKNLGDAFLLVWRIGFYDPSLHAKIADLSVLSFVQILSAVNRDHHLAEWRAHPVLTARFGTNYRVSLGFGLHLGWSIEGAIGSEFKIDAGYLSCNVNMAMGLEGMSKHYRALILMSQDLVRACSKDLLPFFRAIDHIKLSGAKSPSRVFTVDLDCSALLVERKGKGRTLTATERHNKRYEDRQRRDRLKLERLEDTYRVSEVFATDIHIQRMRAMYHLGFFQAWENGYLNYEAGEWDVARRVFLQTQTMLQDHGQQCCVDGPSAALLEYMRETRYEAPLAWPGYRQQAGTRGTDDVKLLTSSGMRAASKTIASRPRTQSAVDTLCFELPPSLENTPRAPTCCDPSMKRGAKQFILSLPSPPFNAGPLPRLSVKDSSPRVPLVLPGPGRLS